MYFYFHLSNLPSFLSFFLKRKKLAYLKSVSRLFLNESYEKGKNKIVKELKVNFNLWRKIENTVRRISLQY